MIERPSTKQAIAHSLIELAEDRDFDKITVDEIAANCGVSRRTFYYHFDDKFDLVTWIYAQQLSETFEGHVHEGYRSVLMASAEVVQKAARYTVNVVENTHGRESALALMGKHADEMYLDYIERMFGRQAVTPRVRFMVGAYNLLTLQAYFEWLRDGRPISPEEMADWVCAAMPEELKPLLNG